MIEHAPLDQRGAGRVISAQLWSLRSELETDGLTQVLDRLAAAGFEHVEPYGIGDPGLAHALRSAGLDSPTAHGDLLGAALGPTLAAAAELGVGVVMHPGFLVESWRAPDGLAMIAEHLNRAAEAAAGYGMRVAFHNHGDELSIRVGDRPALLALMDLVDSRVGVEFDAHWAMTAGADGAEVIPALGDHVFALHLKDGPLTGSHADQAALGDGSLDWEGMLALAPPAIPLVLAPDEIAHPFDAITRSKGWLDAHAALI
jgi:sugar phosphate isomerase/epimerase